MRHLALTTLALGGLLAAGAASATTITQTASITGLTDFNTSNFSPSFSKFNSALGTLNSVTFTATYGFNSVITVTATTASTGSVKTESAARFGASDSAVQNVLYSAVDQITGGASIGASTLTPVVYDLLGAGAAYNQAGGTTQTYNSNKATQTQTTSTTAAADLAAFTGTSTSTFNAQLTTLTGLLTTQTGGNVSASQATTATAGLTIVYDYTAAVTQVPEPASMALVATALGGMTMLRRRRSV